VLAALENLGLNSHLKMDDVALYGAPPMADPKPPFDPVRFACYLIAAVLSVECIVVLAGAAACIWHAEKIISDPSIVCDPKDRMTALLTGALAAALALLAGFRGGPGPPPPDKEP
jgi:hypothetical protein